MSLNSSPLEGIYPFLDHVFENLMRVGMDVQNFKLDHLCFRVSSIEEYQLVKSKFHQIAALLHEAQINGRSIATYRLHAPVEYKNRNISCVEVPAPKTGKPTPTGWEHVEFVIQESFDEFIKRHPHVEFDLSGVSKVHNPEIVLSFGDCVVKFHHEALEDAIAREFFT